MAYAIDTAAAISDIEEAGAEPAVARAIVRTVASVGDELATKSDLATLKSELKDDISAVKSDISAVKSELKDDISAVKSELKDDISAVKDEITAVKSELKDEITEIKGELATVKAEQKASNADLRSTLTIRIVGFQALFSGLLFAALRFGGT